MLTSIRHVKFLKMSKLNMFITADCVLFLIKVRWPKNKGRGVASFCARKGVNTSKRAHLGFGAAPGGGDLPAQES